MLPLKKTEGHFGYARQIINMAVTIIRSWLYLIVHFIKAFSNLLSVVYSHINWWKVIECLRVYNNLLKHQVQFYYESQCLYLLCQILFFACLFLDTPLQPPLLVCFWLFTITLLNRLYENFVLKCSVVRNSCTVNLF